LYCLFFLKIFGIHYPINNKLIDGHKMITEFVLKTKKFTIKGLITTKSYSHVFIVYATKMLIIGSNLVI